jgi:hypothetical protein
MIGLTAICLDGDRVGADVSIADVKNLSRNLKEYERMTLKRRQPLKPESGSHRVIKPLNTP